MEDICVMQSFQSLHNQNKYAPNLLFSQIGLLTLVPLYFLEQISIVCILHDYTVDKL